MITYLKWERLQPKWWCFSIIIRAGTLRNYYLRLKCEHASLTKLVTNLLIKGNKMIGNAILLLRRKENLSQRELAERIGVTKSYISQIESNSKIPRIDQLKLFCKELNTSLTNLLLLAEFDGDLESIDKKKAAKHLISVVQEFNKQLGVENEAALIFKNAGLDTNLSLDKSLE